MMNFVVLIIVFLINFQIVEGSTAPSGLWTWGHNLRGQLGLGDGLYLGNPDYPTEVPGCTDTQSDTSMCDPSRTRLLVPQPLPFSIEQVVHVDAGAYHSILVTSAGHLYSWGWNGYGQLGTDINLQTYGLPQHPSDWNQMNSPTRVRGADNVIFVTASAGMYHSVAISVDGKGYAWGLNYEGQLGLGTLENQPGARLMLSISGVNWIDVDVGQEHTALIGNDRHVYTCGSNRMNQLGQTQVDFPLRSAAPVRIQSLDDTVKVSAGTFHTLALMRNGSLYCFGDNRFAQHGLGPLQQLRPVDAPNPVSQVLFFDGAVYLADVEVNPSQPSNTLYAIDMAAGGHHNVALLVKLNVGTDFEHVTLRMIPDYFRKRGSPPPSTDEFDRYVFTWGLNDYQQLGYAKVERTAVDVNTPYDQLQDVTIQYRPRSVDFLARARVMAVYAGNFNAAVLQDPVYNYRTCSGVSQWQPTNPVQFCSGYQLLMWGSNCDGELGMANMSDCYATKVSITDAVVPPGLLYPSPVPKLIGRNVTLMSLGYRHSIALLGGCPLSSSDACGVCFGDSKSCAGCDGVPNSNKTLDNCGVCGGDDSTCSGCDGIPNSRKVRDACGVCGGDGSTCADCSGISGGKKVYDACGICGGDSTTCQGCDGVPNSGKKFDECEQCGGDNSGCSIVLLLMAESTCQSVSFILLFSLSSLISCILLYFY